MIQQLEQPAKTFVPLGMDRTQHVATFSKLGNELLSAAVIFDVANHRRGWYVSVATQTPRPCSSLIRRGGLEIAFMGERHAARQ